MLTDDFVQRIISGADVHSDAKELMHGYVVLLDNKIWRDSNGRFIFQDEDPANGSFYRDMRSCIANQYRRDGADMSEYRDTRSSWLEFKRMAGFRIAHI